MLARDHPHPFPGWWQRVLNPVYEVSSAPSTRTDHAIADGVLEMEVCIREKRKADFLAGEGSFKAILKNERVN